MKWAYRKVKGQNYFEIYDEHSLSKAGIVYLSDEVEAIRFVNRLNKEYSNQVKETEDA